MDIKFNMLGTFVSILLFLISFIFSFVFKPNYLNRYSQVKTNLKQNAVKFSNSYSKINNLNTIFREKRNSFWSKDIAKNKIFIRKRSFLSNSLYAYDESIFKTLILIKKKNIFFWEIQLLIKIFLFIASLFAHFFLIILFVPGIISVFSLILLFAIFEFIINFKNICKIKKQEKWLLGKAGFNQKDINKSLKFKIFFILKKYIEVWGNSLIELGILFKKWGHDG